MSQVDEGVFFQYEHDANGYVVCVSSTATAEAADEGGLVRKLPLACGGFVEYNGAGRIMFVAVNTPERDTARLFDDGTTVRLRFREANHISIEAPCVGLRLHRDTSSDEIVGLVILAPAR